MVARQWDEHVLVLGAMAVDSVDAITYGSNHSVVGDERAFGYGVALYEVTCGDVLRIALEELDGTVLVHGGHVGKERILEVILSHGDAVGLWRRIGACTEVPYALLVHERLEVEQRHLVDDVHETLGIGIAAGYGFAGNHNVKVEE